MSTAVDGSGEQRLSQRAQYVGNGIAVGIMAIHPDPEYQAVRLVVRDRSGNGNPELLVTVHPGDVVEYGARRLTVTAVVPPPADREDGYRAVGYVTFFDRPARG